MFELGLAKSFFGFTATIPLLLHNRHRLHMLAGPSPAAQPRSRRSTRSDGSGGRRLSGDAPAYMQSTASVRAKQSSRREQPNAKRWTVG